MAALHAAAFTAERPWTAAEFTQLLATSGAFLRTQAEGFALGRAVAGEAELLTIAVHPRAQGRGIGGALMTAWLDRAAEEASAAFLEVAADNGAAIALYHRHGFATVARRAGYYRRVAARADALVMRAALAIARTAQP